MKLVNPNKLSKKDLVKFVREVQEWFFVEDFTGEVKPEKDMGGADTVDQMLQLLDDYGLKEIEGGVECYFCHKKTDEKVAHKLDDKFCCEGCWDERLRQ